MPTITASLPANARFEFALAKVIDGKEDQLFGQYFPQVGPIVGSHGGRPVGSFKVEGRPDNSADVSFGALFMWPSRAAYDALHDDDRFKKIVHLRTEALSVLDSGNFFDTGDGVELSLDSDTSYAVVMADAAIPGAILSLPSAADTDGTGFAGKVLSLLPAADAPTGGTRYDIRLNPPAA